MKTIRIAMLIWLAVGVAVGQQLHLSGTVTAGKPVTQSLGRGLDLRITTESIAVQAAANGADGDNFATCVTPPVHGPSPLDVQAWHFDPAQQNQGPGLKRSFLFATSAADNKAMCDELDRVLDPTAAQNMSAKMPEARLGGGTVTLSHVVVSDAGDIDKAAVQSFDFTADVTLPVRRTRR